ncbi:MAG: hypothetical protein HYY06_08835 [Deltaproteobacteria bacterium]|nr:hypothetical protein [Deltaproteobacteria bacterium]
MTPSSPRAGDTIADPDGESAASRRWHVHCMPEGAGSRDAREVAAERRSGLRHELVPAVGGGLVAGVAGGAVMGILMMFLRALAQRDIWTWLKLAAIPLLGDRATRPGLDPGAVLVGAAVHFAISATWGLVFGILFHGLTRGVTVIAGAVWGITVWLVMFYLVLPVAGAGQVVRTMPVALALFEHLAFGLSVGAGFLPFQRPLVARIPVTP